MTVHTDRKMLIQAVWEYATSFPGWPREDWELQWMSSYALEVVSCELQTNSMAVI